MACLACYPLDLIRTRLTVDCTPAVPSMIKGAIKQNKSTISGTFISIVKSEGFSGLYRGLFVSLAVSVPNLAIGFSMYGTAKEIILSNPYCKFLRNESHPGSLTPVGSLLSGAVSGISSSLVVFPADVIRRRLQVLGMTSSNDRKEAPSAFRHFMIIFRSDGIRGFYRGIIPELLKVTPMVGFTFASYELCMRMLDS